MNPGIEKRALVLGSLAFDYIMDSPENYYECLAINHDTKIVQGTFLSVKKIVNFGGTAGNIAYNMAQVGGRPIVAATVGPDFKTLGYEKHLHAWNVDLRVNEFDGDSTASCYIFNDAVKNQLTVFHGGALNHSDKIDLSAIVREEDGISIAINAPNNMAAMVNFAKQLSTLGVPSIFDPGQVLGALTDEQFTTILDHSTAFISNEHELLAVNKRFGIDVADLPGGLEWIITTKGGDGSVVKTRDDEVTLPVAKVSTVADPTGAGDAFRGGLLRGLTMGLDLVSSAKIGAILGAITVEKPGPQSHVVDKENFKKRYQATFGEPCPF